MGILSGRCVFLLIFRPSVNVEEGEEEIRLRDGVGRDWGEEGRGRAFSFRLNICGARFERIADVFTGWGDVVVVPPAGHGLRIQRQADGEHPGILRERRRVVAWEEGWLASVPVFAHFVVRIRARFWTRISVFVVERGLC